jgi:hypothetical protein
VQWGRVHNPAGFNLQWSCIPTGVYALLHTKPGLSMSTTISRGTHSLTHPPVCPCCSFLPCAGYPFAIGTLGGTLVPQLTQYKNLEIL